MNLNVLTQRIDEVEGTCAHFDDSENPHCTIGKDLRAATDTECMPCCPRMFDNRSPWLCDSMRFPSHEEAIDKVRKVVTESRRKAFVAQTVFEDLVVKGFFHEDVAEEEHTDTCPCPLCLSGTLSYTRHVPTYDEDMKTDVALADIACSTPSCIAAQGKIVKITKEHIDRLRRALSGEDDDE